MSGYPLEVRRARSGPGLRPGPCRQARWGGRGSTVNGAAFAVHPRAAMRILRHSKIAITMEIYTEVPDARTRDALRRLGDQLDG